MCCDSRRWRHHAGEVTRVASAYPIQRSSERRSRKDRRLLQNAFVIRRSHTTYFNWQTLYSLLLQAVEERDILLTKAVLDTFQALLEEHACVFGQFMEELKGMGAIPPGDFNSALRLPF